MVVLKGYVIAIAMEAVPLKRPELAMADLGSKITEASWQYITISSQIDPFNYHNK